MMLEETKMTDDGISVKPLSPIIGAEIGGVDLSKPLGNHIFQKIHNALIGYQVIFFHDQKINLLQQKAFGQQFGPLHIHPAAPPTDGDSEIKTIHADEKSVAALDDQWHTDVS